MRFLQANFLGQTCHRKFAWRNRMITRRHLLEGAGAGAALAGLDIAAPQSALAAAAGLNLPPALPDGVRNSATLEALPGKKPLLKLSYLLPNYQPPIEYFRTAITPNDAFFVRYHLANIPQVDAATWKLAIDGDGANQAIQIGLDDLKRLPAVELNAVCQCSGNRRGLFQ